MARRPPDESIRRMNFRERVSPSLWFTPGLFVVGAFVLSKVSVAVDQSFGPESPPGWLLGADPTAAGSLTATVAAATLALVSVVFSTTLVAIQLAGGQYSPRVVRVFVRARITHVTLGLFLATFVVALNALVEISANEDVVPVVTVSMVYLLLLATLGGFITFVHSIAKMLRVQYLLDRVTAEGRRSILAEFGADEHYRPAPEPVNSVGTPVRNVGRTGVIQAIDRSGLVALARGLDAWIELLVEAGEYVGRGTPIALVHGSTNAGLSSASVTGRLLFGSERTMVHDPNFAIRQLVDVAVRALSPAVNDPTTAVQAIDRINDLLGTIAGQVDPSGWYVDDVDVVRLKLREARFDRLIQLSYTEIIRYGADSPQVVRRLHAAFDVLESIARPGDAEAVARIRTMLDVATAEAMPRAFVDVGTVPDRHGLG